MAPKRPKEPDKTPRSVSPSKGIEMIQRQIAEADVFLKQSPIISEAIDGWDIHTMSVVVKAFGSGGPQEGIYGGAGAMGFIRRDPSPEEAQQDLRGFLQSKIAVLRAFVKILADEVEDAQNVAASGGPGGLDYIDLAIVCADGHVINPESQANPENNHKFCQRCGEPAVHHCSNQNCAMGIRGVDHKRGAPSAANWSPPAFCSHCGTAFPWTERKTRQLIETIDEIEDVEAEDRNRMKSYARDIISETTQSGSATRFWKKVAEKAGGSAQKIIETLIANVGAAWVKQQWGMH